MSNSGSSAGDVFDLKKIRRLVELMKEHDLGEIDLHQGEQRIRLRRGVDVSVVSTPAAAPSSASGKPAPAAASTIATPAEAAHIAFVKSPMVGTYYASSSPDSPPFIKVGDHVGADSIVCIVEAMKVFNEIPAEVSGKVVAVLVQNGDPVEYGQSLFKVDTSQ